MSIFGSRTQTRQAPPLEDLRRRAVARLRSLLQTLSGQASDTAELDSLSSLFGSLQPHAAESGWAAKRLQAAQRYLRSQEVGAARYELRLLLGSVS